MIQIILLLLLFSIGLNQVSDNSPLPLKFNQHHQLVLPKNQFLQHHHIRPERMLPKTSRSDECDDGYVENCEEGGILDCVPESWIGDELPDCGYYTGAGASDLSCYDCDGGDCLGISPECSYCGDGVCSWGETIETCPEDCSSSEACEDCLYDYTPYGSECCDTAWEEYGISCWRLENNYGWDCEGCNCPGDVPPECGDGKCNGNETEESCPEDCGECNESWYVPDCTTGECVPEYWIGDGYCADGNDYTPDLTCWGCDGGDCDCCGDGYCGYYESVDDCPEDCSSSDECPEGQVPDCADDDCCPEAWIGDDWADCSDQEYGCDLTCYDCDGGDCIGIDSDCGEIDDCCTPGDYNCDYSIDVLDIVAIVNCILDDADCPCADVNGDGEVNVLDVVALVNMILGDI